MTYTYTKQTKIRVQDIYDNENKLMKTLPTSWAVIAFRPPRKDEHFVTTYFEVEKAGGDFDCDNPRLIVVKQIPWSEIWS